MRVIGRVGNAAIPVGEVVIDPDVFHCQPVHALLMQQIPVWYLIISPPDHQHRILTDQDRVLMIRHASVMLDR